MATVQYHALGAYAKSVYLVFFQFGICILIRPPQEAPFKFYIAGELRQIYFTPKETKVESKLDVWCHINHFRHQSPLQDSSLEIPKPSPEGKKQDQ